MSTGYSELIETITDIPIDDYIERNYNVVFKNSSGKNRQACCCLPGHGVDKTPSLNYHRDTNKISCFGCHQLNRSNLINFVALMEGLDTSGEDFKEILKIICENEGIDYNFDTYKEDPMKKKKKEFKTRCATLYSKELWEEKNSHALSYLKNRGFTEQTIRDFHLGITSQNENRYGRKGISNRICVPILDSKGTNVIACSFRKLSDMDSGPKYLHDNNDEIFDKKNILYGWSHAIKYIRERKHVYVVEGYFDMISFYQAGIKNTVACMSSGLTEHQILLLSKVVKNITLVLDQDQAGEQGFIRTLPIMLEAGLNVRVVKSLKYKGKDANDLCINFEWDNKKIESFINSNDEDAVRVLLSSILDKYDDTMLKARDTVLRVSDVLLDCITDKTKKKNYSSYVKNRIGL